MVGMADGYAQASGRASVANLHTAPGVGNAMGAIFNAQANHSPVLVTAGQQTRAQITLQANLTNRDAIRMPHPLVKWSFEPARAEDVPLALAHGAHLAALPPKGPTFVSIPMDDWYAEVDEADAAHAIGREVGGRAVADPDAVRALAERLDAASNPVLVAGPDIDASGGWDAAVALAERQRLPVWASPATGGARLGFPESHPNFRGVLPPAIGPVGQTLEGHDLILVAGSSVFPYYPHIPGPLLPEGAALVAITSDPEEAARAPMGDAIVADVGAHPRGAARAGAGVLAPRPRAQPRPAGNPRHRPAQLLHRPHRPRRGPARGRDRRPRVARQHPRPAQPAAPLAAGQLLLQRRRRPRLRPRGVGRSPARPARPARRLRARRGLRPVRDRRLLERRRLRGPGHLPRPQEQRVRDPQVVRRGRAGEPAPPASTCRRSTSPPSPPATASPPAGRAAATRSATRSRRRSAPRGRSWSKSRSSRACPSSKAMSGAAAEPAPPPPPTARPTRSRAAPPSRCAASSRPCSAPTASSAAPATSSATPPTPAPTGCCRRRWSWPATRTTSPRSSTTGAAAARRSSSGPAAPASTARARATASSSTCAATSAASRSRRAESWLGSSPAPCSATPTASSPRTGASSAPTRPAPTSPRSAA